MGDIKPKLVLNKHPKDSDNLSLIDARNIQLSKDISVLENEKSFLIFDKSIRTLLKNIDYKIVGCIPCNTEFVFFIKDISVNDKCYIIRAQEDGAAKIVYENYEYHGGTIIGTFTYNSRNELIIAVSEYDGTEDVPLKTFSLGTYENNTSDDLDLSYDNLSLCPTVKIPDMYDIEYIDGKTTKGWYNFFIRFKINKNDYTQWYSINNGIYIGNLEKSNFFKIYGFVGEAQSTSSTNKEKYVTGITDSIDGKSNYSNETITFTLGNKKYNTNKVITRRLAAINPEYKFYQLAYVCSSNTYNLCRRTNDIDINIYRYNVFDELFNNEIDISELTNSFYNYYNIKNLINYNNRLYISNYKEKEDIKNIDEILSNIRIYCEQGIYHDSSTLYSLWDEKNQYISENKQEISLVSAFLLRDNQEVDAIVKIDPPINIRSFLLSDNFITFKTIKEDEYTDITVNNDTTNFKLNIDKTYSELDNVDLKLENSSYITANNDKYYINETLKGNIEIKYVPGGPGEQGEYRYIRTVKYSISITIGENTFTLNAENTLNTSDLNSNVKITSLNITSCNFKNGIESIALSGEAKDLVIKTDGKDSIIYNTSTSKSYSNATNLYINNKLIATVDLASLKTHAFIDPSHTFKKRKVNTTLIPGEVYNFYIHFIDKYGESTRGYRLNNTSKILYKNENEEYIEGIPIFINQSITKLSYYKFAFVPPNTKVFTSNGEVNIPSKTLYFTYGTNFDTKITFSGGNLIITGTPNKTGEELLKNILIELNNDQSLYYEDLKVGLDLKFDDLSTNNKTGVFIKYNNSNEDSLFKVPNVDINISSNGETIDIIYPKFYLSFSGVKIPDGYIGYYFSYEKIEKSNKLVGILSNGDFTNKKFTEDSTNGFLNVTNGTNAQMYFYTGNLDIDDQIDLNYSYIYIQSKISFEERDENNATVSELNSAFNYYNLNQPIIETEKQSKYLRLGNFKVAAGGDITKNRNGLGTALVFDNQYDLFPTDGYYFYYATLYKSNRYIYTNKTKSLIRFSPIYYTQSSNATVIPIENGYNGLYSINSQLCYNINKFIFNEATTKVVNNLYKNYDNKYAVATYFQFPVIDTKFNETKHFNNEPKNSATLINSIGDIDEKDQLGEFSISSLVTPENSIDLFKNNFGDKDNYNIKYLSNYNEDAEYVYEFGKYIRRSNVIQDESLENSWRQFPIEGYKIITENKGVITNIIGLGTVLLVHTEHSMFIIDRNNIMQTNDKNIQLTMPDIFDLEYKEVVTDTMGYAGLQDKFACIVGSFGYIFFDNDSNRFFRFDSNSLNYIDEDIINFLYYYKLTNVRFFNDINNNRLIISFNIDKETKRKTLSYNYKTNNFISWHDYSFDKSYGSKNIYLAITSINNRDIIRYFSDKLNYGFIENRTESIANDIKISILVNENYSVVKFLETITYKLYFKDCKNTNYYDPINKVLEPYSGLTIRIYNNLIDTGIMDISVDEEENKNIYGEYKKPYWDLGNWNLSYLRNTKTGESISDTMSRLYGNFFVIEITANNEESYKKIEFETLSYKISKNNKL